MLTHFRVWGLIAAPLYIQNSTFYSPLTRLVLDTDAKHSQDVGRLKHFHGFHILFETSFQLPIWQWHGGRKKERGTVTDMLYLLQLVLKVNKSTKITKWWMQLGKRKLVLSWNVHRPYVGGRRVSVSLDGHWETTVLSSVDLWGWRCPEGLLGQAVNKLVFKILLFDDLDAHIVGLLHCENMWSKVSLGQDL